ncbi:MAG: xylulokinase, partial [Clostridia bacterium]|nr:xylulokinase [Clostridia bacterium]
MYIGLDLGTSSLKGILTNEKGVVIKEASYDYAVFYPQNGWSEQNPDDWIIAVNEVIGALIKGVNDKIKGVSVGGQMHGLVALDKNGKVIRPCILWNDGRTEKQTAYLNEVVGKERLSAYTANIAFAGFTAPKLLWLKENEPENFARISKIMLPKDYVVFKLTGKFSTDFSDASGTLLLDVKNKCWSKEMCDICSVKAEWLPDLYESYDVVGKVLPEYGMPNAVVTAGAGDNAAAAIGTGTVFDGGCNISLGTSGTVFIAKDDFTVDEKNALHSFCH